MKPFFVAFVFLFWCQVRHEAIASELTAADLHSFCTSTDREEKAACRFYLLGVAQGIGVAAGLAGDKNHFCLPDDIAQSQMVEIFERTVQNLKRLFPKDMDMPAVGIFGAALAKEYPCSRHKSDR